MKTSVKQRLKEFLAYKDVGQRRFASMCGLSYGFVASISQSIQPKTMDRISERFPELNPGWLLTGEGDMLRSSVPSVSPTPDGVAAPYFDVDFRGGFDFLYNDQTTVPSGFVSVPGAMRVSCWCNVSGRSMEPDISPGDIVGLQLVEDTSFLPFGEIYAVVTRSGMRTVKRIGPSHTQGCVSLIPSNSSPEYAPQDIPLAELVTVFRIVAKITKF